MDIEPKKEPPRLLVAIALVVLIVIIGAVWYLRNWTFPIHESLRSSCTMEAKLCPDGSYVSRTGPNCEFTECPIPLNDRQDTSQVLNTLPLEERNQLIESAHAFVEYSSVSGM